MKLWPWNRYKHIKRKKVTVGGKAVSYLEAGQGKTLLLLHGWPMCSDIFRPLMVVLRTRFRLIAPDLPGFGGSGELEEEHTYEQMARHLSDFLAAIGTKKVVVAGVSFGAAVALEMGRLYPQKVKKLIINSPPLQYSKRLSIIQKILLAGMSGQPQLREMVFNNIKKPNSIGQHLLWRKKEQVNPVFARRVYRRAKRIKFRVFDETLKEIVGINLFEQLPKISVPVVLLCGEEDKLFLEDTIRAAGEIPKAEFWRIKKAGHTAVVTHVDQVARLICYTI